MRELPERLHDSESLHAGLAAKIEAVTTLQILEDMNFFNHQSTLEIEDSIQVCACVRAPRACMLRARACCVLVHAMRADLTRDPVAVCISPRLLG